MRALFTTPLLLAALAGCETTNEAKARQMRPWLGQPVQAFAETYSVTPTTAYRDTYGQQTYMFQIPRGLGSCGVTIKSMRGEGAEQVISEMTSTCPPGTL